MLKMKKIVGILLALCFLVSVTAATAAASDDGHREGPGDHHKPKFDQHKPKFDRHEREHGWGERDNHKFNDHHKKRHHHPAHWEKKKFGHREFRNNHWTTVYVYKTVFVKEYYDYHY